VYDLTPLTCSDILILKDVWGMRQLIYQKRKLKKFFGNILLIGSRVKKAPFASFRTCG